MHGAGVNREIDRGLAVSIAGVVYESITVGTDPGLPAAEAAVRFETATGGRLAPGRAPVLTVLPLADGSYALIWKITSSGGETAFVDAHDGRLFSGAP